MPMLASPPLADPSLSAQINSLVVIFGRNRTNFGQKLDSRDTSWRRVQGMEVAPTVVSEVESMKTYSRLAFLISFLIPWSLTVVMAQTSANEFYRQWVDFRDGEISVAFDQTPLRFALHAIHAGTGFQIVIPSSTETKILNLRLHRQALEPAMRSLISTIGYKNFALMYDDKGRPHRAVVLDAQLVATDATVGPAKNEPAVQPLTVEEHEKLKKDLERWSELTQEERGRIEDRLKTLAASEEREELVREYGKQVLAMTK
jgi:hypothetical protein